MFCGLLLEAGLHDLCSPPIADVLSPMNRRNSLSSSVSFIISVQIGTSSTQNSNSLIYERPQYSLGIYHLYALPFELKPPIPISQ